MTQLNANCRPAGRSEFAMLPVLDGECTLSARGPIELLDSPPADLDRRDPTPQAPRVVAPLVDGLAASSTAVRLLLGAGQQREVHLDIRTGSTRLRCRGPFQPAMPTSTTLRLAAAGLRADIRFEQIVAVSHCANSTACGFALFAEAGNFLTVWSTNVHGFDAWLHSALHNLDQDDAPAAQRRAWAEVPGASQRKAGRCSADFGASRASRLQIDQGSVPLLEAAR